MKDLVFIHNGQALTTSLTVAEVFEKRHGNVIRDIENCLTTLRNIRTEFMFQKSTYKVEGQNRKYPMYYINREGFLLLAMNLSGKKAMQFKLELIKRGNFASLEELLNINLEPLDAHQCYIYILNLNNKTVKIGKTTNLQQRFTQIVNQSGLDILDGVHSVALSATDANRIETALKNHFNKYQTNGEFFYISFDQACCELQKYAEIASYF